MRAQLFAAGLVAALAVVLAATGHAQPDYPPAPDAAPQAGPPPAPLRTPDQAGRENVESAASAPLHDLNLVSARIPPVLLAAMADPYARPSPPSCARIADDVDGLTQALGDDLDAPPPGEQTAAQKRSALSLALMHTAAESLLPYSGFVRTLSGAAKHDRLVIRAIIAGSARRGYLKGLGEVRRCFPPAAPRHLARPATPPPLDHAMPRYPIK